MFHVFPYAKKNIYPQLFEKILTRWDKALMGCSLFSEVSASFLWRSCEAEHALAADCYEFTFIATLVDLAIHLCSLMEDITKTTYTDKTIAQLCKALLYQKCKGWCPSTALRGNSQWFLPEEVLSAKQLKGRFCTFPQAFLAHSNFSVNVCEDDFFADFLNFRLGEVSDCDSTTAGDSLSSRSEKDHTTNETSQVEE